MAKTGLRLDVSKIRAKLASAKSQIEAESFKPELLDFTRKSLNTASKETPTRSYSTIKRNQAVQYRHYINFIPSYADRPSPSLRVRGNKHWLYMDGKWILAYPGRRLSGRQWAAYQSLLAERQRRMQVSRSDFIANRAQARFLYPKVWGQVGESLGISVRQGNNIRTSRTRRKPPEEPPRGYGQIRGGKRVLSVVIFAPFLEQPTRYWRTTGSRILGGAMEGHEPQFKRRVDGKLRRMLFAIMSK